MDFEKFNNPETYAEAALEAQDYIKNLEGQVQDLTKSRDTLMESNQKMFMRITSNQEVQETPKERTPEEVRRDFVSRFIKEDA